MKSEATLDHATFVVPADLDPTTVGAVHADLVRTVGQDGAGAIVVSLGGDVPPSLLTLQLLVGARRSRSAAALSFCERAEAALAEVGSKEGALT